MKRLEPTPNEMGFVNLSDYGIILESKPILDTILTLDYDFKVISSYHLDYDWYYLEVEGKKITVAVSQGASMVVDLSERYIASGAKKIIRIGTTGALIPTLKLGDYVIPYASIKDEGTSKFYIQTESPAIADIDLVNMLSEKLRVRDNVVNNGIVWSTDGRWKETTDAVESRVGDGAIATDMESSALFSLGINRKTAVASISVLSDVIYNAVGEFRGFSDKDIWVYRVLPKTKEAFITIMELIREEVI